MKKNNKESYNGFIEELGIDEERLTNECIQMAQKIKRTLENIAVSTQYYKPNDVESSYSFFGPRFCIDARAHFDSDRLLNEQFKFFVRKFLSHRDLEYHDIKVTYITKNNVSFHNHPGIFNIGYFRVDYVSTKEIPAVVLSDDRRPIFFENEVEYNYYTLMIDGKKRYVSIIDGAGIKNLFDTLKVNIEDFNSIKMSDNFAYVAPEELIHLDVEYLFKTCIMELVSLDKISSAKFLLDNLKMKNIELPPFFDKEMEIKYQSALKKAVEGNNECSSNIYGPNPSYDENSAIDPVIKLHYCDLQRSKMSDIDSVKKFNKKCQSSSDTTTNK